MAELTAGAVNALLGVLRNELLLLGRLGGDVKFIKEEMESMNSFLAHLTKRKPPGGEHDEQVRTWMKQVRELAHDCSNCIDLYLRRGDPQIHANRSRTPLQGHVLWLVWFVRKIIAQHRVATELRVLKERAREVGERRVRYGVTVPADNAAPVTSPAEDEETFYENHRQAAVTADGGSDHRRQVLQPRTTEEYCADRLVDWLKALQTNPAAERLPCIAIVVVESTGTNIHQVLDSATDHFDYQVVWINLPALHFSWNLPLEACEILSYIRLKYQGMHQQEGTFPQKKKIQDSISMESMRKAFFFKQNDYYTAYKKIEIINITNKIGEIRKKIEEAKTSKSTDQEVQRRIKETWRKKKKIAPLDILFEALAAPTQTQEKSNDPADSSSASTPTPSLEEVAKLLKAFMEDVKPHKEPEIDLDIIQYEDILRKVFPESRSNEPLQAQEAMASSTAAAGVGEDQIREIVRKIALGILWELQGGNSSGGHDEQTKTTSALGDALAAATEEAKKKLPEISAEINDQMTIKATLDKLKKELQGKKILIILQDDGDYISSLQWEYTRKALSSIGCAPRSAVIVTTKNSQKAREFCNPEQEPITCSLAGVYYDRLLRLTVQHKKNDKQHAKILRDILNKCARDDEFSMKIFAHALRANPNRSNEELIQLQDHLVLNNPLTGSNATHMFMFSYNDLQKDYKSCLLYLAVFPQDNRIRRSTLIGRWIVEGLISKEDWPTSVIHAERCFNTLIDRWLVDPGAVGATGQIKSCMVGKQVHEIITKMAKKHHMVEARLSHHLACHFSIFSDLRLRRSDKICDFVQNLYKYALQLSLLKVLDLEGCWCFGNSDRYLKGICNKIVLLKYLSLRRTDATCLPREINNLHELEILDIRDTKVPAPNTKEIVLLKLKRLMAGRTLYPSPSRNHSGKAISDGEPFFFSVQIPYKIAKMENMEVLSNVEASGTGKVLQDIGKLSHLRKLGVVISDNPTHLKNLLQAISDLNENLQYLSITLLESGSKGTPSSEDVNLWDDIRLKIVEPPKNIKSLNISGTTQTGHLLLLLLSKGLDLLTKVSLQNTSLKEKNMKDIAKLPDLRDFRLRHKSYTGRKLAFKKGKFQNLKNLLIEGSNMTEVVFGDGAAPNIESIKLSSATIIAIIIENAAAQLKKIDLSDTGITTIQFKEGAAPGLQEVTMSSTNISSINFEDNATPNLNKMALSNTNVQFLFGINYLSRLKEIELHDSRITDINDLGKVTLRGTSRKQAYMQILARQPNLESLVLLPCDEAHGRQLSFNKDEFQDLKLLVVKCVGITKMSFAEGAAPKLEKIAWFFNKIESLSGIKNLTNLKEVELIGGYIPRQVREDIEKHPKCVLKQPQDLGRTETTATDSD